MTYNELVSAIETYTENTFPDTTLSDGTLVSSTTQLNRFIEQAEQRIYNSVQFPSLRKNVTGGLTSNNKYLSAPDDFLSTYSLAAISPTTGEYTFLLNKDVNFIREAYPSPTSTGAPKYYALFGPTVSSGVISNELSFLIGPTPDASYAVELHYYYYPASIIQGAISTIQITTTGSSLTPGVYYNINLTGGTGNSAKGTVIVSASGLVTSITITNPGAYYIVNDVLTASLTDIGSTGTAFTATITAINNSTGQSWLGDNFDTVLLYGCLVEAYTYMKGEADLIALYDGKYKEALVLAKRLGDGLERSDAYRSGQYREMPLPQNNGVR